MDSARNAVRRSHKPNHDERSGDDELGSRIARIMREKGMSQPELARESGVSLTVVTRLLTGRRMTTFHNIEAIATALGVSLDEFRPEEHRPEADTGSDVNGEILDSDPNVLIGGRKTKLEVGSKKKQRKSDVREPDSERGTWR